MRIIALIKGMLFLSFFIVLPIAKAASTGSGTVTMNGEITDAACNIAMESQDQVINMGVIPIAVINQLGGGPTRDVDIYLVDCELVKDSDPSKTWKTLQMTFDGPSKDGLFEVMGEAKGVALYMQDENQQQVLPGEALPEQEITPPTMRLSYKLRLVSDNQPLRAGAYQSIIRFKVDYY